MFDTSLFPKQHRTSQSFQDKLIRDAAFCTICVGREWKVMMWCRWLKVGIVWRSLRTVHQRCMTSCRPAGHTSKFMSPHSNHWINRTLGADGHFKYMLAVLSFRAEDRPGFHVVEPRLRDYYYDIAQWLFRWMLYYYAIFSWINL